MIRNQKINILVALLCVVPLFSISAKDLEVEGVFGLDNVSTDTEVAVWVPLSQGEAIEGIRWYNNDRMTVFPEVHVFAGRNGGPGFSDLPLVVGESVSGLSSSWSDLFFPQPLASESEGLYIVFRLPEGSVFQSVGDGGGAGFGYSIGDGSRRSWITGDGEHWDPVSSDIRLAASAIMRVSKSAGVRTLRLAGEMDEPHKKLLPGGDATNAMTATPNPFNPLTEICFSLDTRGIVELTIFDVRGMRVRSLNSSVLNAGAHFREWDGKNDQSHSVSSGVYFVRLKSGTKLETLRLALVR